MSSDDLTQQLADAIAGNLSPDTLSWTQAAARAILASGLVVPTSAVNDLAQSWETRDIGMKNHTRLACATELRALNDRSKQ